MINMLVKVMNKDIVETRRVGDIEIRYSGSVVKFMYNPETPTPRRMSTD